MQNYLEFGVVLAEMTASSGDPVQFRQVSLSKYLRLQMIHNVSILASLYSAEAIH